MRKKLIYAINYEMAMIGNTDVIIDNIRFFERDNNQYAMADVSYTWWLDAWDNKVNYKDMIFVFIDGKWFSPIFNERIITC